MWKFIKRSVVLLLVLALVYSLSVFSDKRELQEEVLRLHVVADSNSQEDQAVKLKVRDAVIQALEPELARVDTKEQAQALISSKLDYLEQVANKTLDDAGASDRAVVTLERESYDTRDYDTFSLPAGVYDSLRITIGSGQGENWWCVVFPSLCMPAASESVEDVAVGAGFSSSLSGAITGEKEYRVRFFLLDCLGKLENFFS